MDEYVIESGVPIPDRTRKGPGGKLKYPWNRMAPGDSVFVEQQPNKSRTYNAAIAAQQWLKRNRPELFAVSRNAIENDKSGVRIWFVEREP